VGVTESREQLTASRVGIRGVLFEPAVGASSFPRDQEDRGYPLKAVRTEKDRKANERKPCERSKTFDACGFKRHT